MFIMIPPKLTVAGIRITVQLHRQLPHTLKLTCKEVRCILVGKVVNMVTATFTINQLRLSQHL